MESGTEVSTSTVILVLVGFGILMLLWRYIAVIWMRVLMALAVTLLLLWPVATGSSYLMAWLSSLKAQPNAEPLKATVGPEAMAVLVTAADSTGNQLFALGLAQFLFVGWAYTAICKGNERRQWPNTLTLLTALMLTLLSAIAGMDAKFTTIAAVVTHLELVEPKAAVQASFELVPFKMLAQATTLLLAVALTLTCLPALWGQGRAAKAAHGTSDQPGS